MFDFLKKKTCKHKLWKVNKLSNMVIIDPSGTPSMYCECFCDACFMKERKWVPVPVSMLNEEGITVVEWFAPAEDER